ncbi:DUF817 domain-containing protein [Streptomyces fructofermentans]|uniref:DUF817 domain-containing protein n=1 Tax=Streptomyces fructofermentans TaxID=152141 RepID=UPI00378E1132
MTIQSITHGCAQFWRFGYDQMRAGSFAVALVGGIGASRLLPADLPVARYDLVLLFGVALTVLARKVGWDGPRDTAVILGCHVVGLLFELVKVRMGSWSYPEEALSKIGGVPLYGGFLYSAVGSYCCRAWRIMDLSLSRYRPRTMAVLAAAVYLNFFTHHWLPDVRLLLAVLLLAATAGTWAHFTVGRSRYRLPLALAFTLIGFFLWVAENAATYVGAWSYPHQLHGWQPVPLDKFGAWALLISVTFVLVARTRDTSHGGGGGAARSGDGPDRSRGTSDRGGHRPAALPTRRRRVLGRGPAEERRGRVSLVGPLRRSSGSAAARPARTTARRTRP